MCLLLSLIVLLVIFAVVWIIIGKIPVPAEYSWIVQVVLLVAFLFCIVDILTGGLSFCAIAGGWHGLGRSC